LGARKGIYKKNKNHLPILNLVLQNTHYRMLSLFFLRFSVPVVGMAYSVFSTSKRPREAPAKDCPQKYQILATFRPQKCYIGQGWRTPAPKSAFSSQNFALQRRLLAAGVSEPLHQN
jgi:hypothetical protein